MSKESGEGYPLPPWEKEVESSLEKKDLGFTLMVKAIGVSVLSGIIGAQALREVVKQIVEKFKKPVADHSLMSGDLEGVMKVFSPEEEERRRGLVEQTGLSTQQDRRPSNNW